MDLILTVQECLDMKEKGQRAIVHNGEVTGFEEEEVHCMEKKNRRN